MSPKENKKLENEPEEEPFGLGCALEMFVEADEAFKMITNLKNIYQDKSLSETAYERFNFVISQYVEQPHLLDSHLDELLETFITNFIRDESSPIELKHAAFKYMFVIVNVRGYKVIVRKLPHEVPDFELVLKMLEAQDEADSETWPTRYILLLWLSIIVMIPFHLSRFDCTNEPGSKVKTVMDRVLDVIKHYIVVPGKCSDAASYLSSHFITRTDVKEQHLSTYLDWVFSISLSPTSDVFAKQGTLSSVAMILKHGKREDLLPHVGRLLEWIVNEEIKNRSGSQVQKLVYKIVQRIGLNFLPPRVASWRYSRGNRSLSENLSGGDGRLAQPEAAPAEVIEEHIEVPDEIEEVIDQLINGLRNENGIVRWSAAKGVGRVTSRLPQDLADQVLVSVLELFSPREGDGAWQGGCLALAELGRRGLLLPKRLPEVVPLVVKALLYDEPRGYSSVGAHIRDAACYVCWSFARAYETHILQPFVNELASTLLIVTCFDREINCRRAASAAFQENVGRQGTFPHGIDILTVADFFAVSVRNSSYLSISIFIAQFEEYTVPLIEHLVDRKVDHWDGAIRELAAKALHNLTSKAPQHMVDIVLPKLFEKVNTIDLNSRHGAVLAIGEILHALSKVPNNVKIEDVVGQTVIDQTRNLVHGFREKFYFRGLGGELMRQACCDFIEKCSLASLQFHKDPVIDDWLSLLDECISYNVHAIQAAAITALPVFLFTYFVSPEMISRRNQIVKKYIHAMLAASQQETRLGYALALGVLPKSILQDHLETIVEALIECTKFNGHTVKWAESRRDAVKALTSIFVAMADEIGHALDDKLILKIVSVFLEGLKDYTQDKRGDVGAWVREACLVGLQTLCVKTVEKDEQVLDENLLTEIVTGVAQQAVEKIDRTRALAAKVFYSIVHGDVIISKIKHFGDLREIFLKSDCSTLNLNSASDTFPKFVQLLQFPPYTYNVMLGIICSVGGLSETLVKYSSSSLFAYMKTEEDTKGESEIIRLCETVHKIFHDHQKNDRITVPMFRFLDKLLGSGTIQIVIDNPESDFSKRILKLILAEIVGCKDVYKLIDAINVLSQFLQIKNEACQSALVQLSILLCHRQTYVRKSTASQLYEALLMYGDGSNINTDNLDEVMNVLSNTNWEDSVENVKPVRNQLCALMGIRIPVLKTKTPA